MTLPFDLGPVTRPVETARGLPNPFYTDPAVFEAEKERLFFRNWAALGFASDVAGPGDARPVDFLGQPLLMVRDKEGRLRVFQNVCRHRGMILVAEPCRIERAIRCPYHSWCYELDGRLRTTPHVGGPGRNRHDEIRRDELGLIEVLRTLRIMHHAAWLAARWDDPAFPRHFPWFGSGRYWAEHVLALREQLAALQEEPLRLRP